MKVCLVMIVKNESTVIKRCLESVKNIIDYACIMDTGSMDDTIKIAWETLSPSIPFTEIGAAWRNFGYNRTLVFEEAKLAYPDADYCLLIDADMVVENHGFDKEKLKDDFYYMNQTSGTLTYKNTRFIRTALPWKCIGVTHEYWTVPGNESLNYGFIESLSIKDVGDGGSKGDKFERDVRLLAQGIIDEPNNGRYVFYLANTYRDLQKWTEAITMYEKRISMDGWEEETWYAMYQKAVCRKWREDPLLDVVNDFMKAFMFRPYRMEPLYQALFMLRCEKFYSLAYAIGKLYAVEEIPKFDMLFIEHDIYNWRLMDEMGMISWWAGFKAEGINYFKRAKEYSGLPEEDKSRIENNLMLH